MQKKPISPSKIPISQTRRLSGNSSPEKRMSQSSNESYDKASDKNSSFSGIQSVTSASNSPIKRNPAHSTFSETKSSKTHASILETVEERVDPNFKEQKIKNRIDGIMNEGPASAKSAESSTLLYLEMPPFSLSRFNIMNISQKLLVLKLTNMKLEKPNIPYVESLRTLFLDNCGLLTLEGFPLLPELKFLSLAHNKLKSFKGIPVCAQLEEIDLNDNAVQFSVEITLQAIASLSLNVFNGAEVQEEQIRAAFQRSPLIGVALRQGLPITNLSSSDDDILNLANDFLIRDFIPVAEKDGISNVRHLSVNEDTAEVTLPIKGTNIKWFINIQPSIKKTIEWEALKDSTKTMRRLLIRKHILCITQMMYQHLIKCEFSLPNDSSNKRYSLYTINVIGADKDLILPFPINPKVTGEPYEGSLVSLAPMPVPCHVSWYIEEELIDNNSSSIRLKDSYIDHEVTCLLQPYCKYKPQITFTRLLTKTDVVMRLNPIVTNLYFPEDIIEGQEFRLECLVLPKREGNSQITLERAMSPSGNWEYVSTLQPFQLTYVPTLDDVGCYLRIKYLPILNDGTRPLNDKPTFFYSSRRVIAGIPEFSSPSIVGEPTSGHSLIAIAKYFGGKKGICGYNWFISAKKIDPTIPFKKQKGVQELNITTANIKLEHEYVGNYLGVEMTPIRNDDTIGTKISTVLPVPISQGHDLVPIRHLPRSDRIVANTSINVIMPVTWFRTNLDHKDSSNKFAGFEKIAVGPEYTPTVLDVGRFLRIVSNDGHSDVVIGEVKPAVPYIGNFSVNNEKNPRVGSTAEIPPEVFIDQIAVEEESQDDLIRGNPEAKIPFSSAHKKVEIVWVRISKGNASNNIIDGESVSTNYIIPINGYIERVVDVDVPVYTFQNDDIGSQIKAIVYPLDDYGRRRSPTHSEPTNVIHPFKYKTPIMNGKLQVDEILSIDFNMPIYSLKWLRTKNIKYETICTFTFSHFEDDVPLYTNDQEPKTKDGPVYYSELGYKVKKNDIDYMIQAEIIAGEIEEEEVEDQETHQIYTVQTMKAKDMFAPLKSSLSPNTSRLSTRVIPKDLHIYLSKHDKKNQITDGQTVTVRIMGADEQGRKPDIIWEKLVDEDQWVEHAKGTSYTFTPSDLHFQFRILCSNTGETIELGSIQPSPPSVSPFTIIQDSDGSIKIDAKYTGGLEGKSKFVYSFIGNDSATLEVKTIKKVTKVDSYHKFTPTRDMFNKRIDVGYIPIRQDDAIGPCVWSTGSLIVKPIPLLDAYLSYPEKMEKGATISCVVRKCSMKSTYRYTWRRFTPSPEDENVFNKENIGENSPNYELTELDNGSYIVCQVIAVAENGYLSPIFIMDSYQIEFIEKPKYTLSISIPARSQADIKSTKRSSNTLSKSAKLQGEVDTGDILKPLLQPRPKRGTDIEYRWQVRENDSDLPLSGSSAKSSQLVNWITVSTLNEYTATILDLGRLIRCVCVIDGNESDEIESLPIGPVKLNPKVEAPAKAVFRANSLKVKGTAPTGSGNWELSFSTKGLTLLSRQGNEQLISWQNVNFIPLRDEPDQLEIITGPASRILIIPELVDKRMSSLIPEGEIRDFCVYIMNLYKTGNFTSPKK